jgi:hypothetical protein
MKGIVFTKLIEMVEETYSVDLAEEILEESELPSGGTYTAVGTYDHQEMVAILVTLSQKTGQPIPALLRAFGHYLFGQFAKLYPAFFVGVNHSIDFIARIENVIHVEVLKLYPDAQLPKFDVLEYTPNFLRIVYRSDRHLGDLAHGLIESCIEHFGEAGVVTLEREDLVEEGQPICFRLTKKSQPSN